MTEDINNPGSPDPNAPTKSGPPPLRRMPFGDPDAVTKMAGDSNAASEEAGAGKKEPADPGEKNAAATRVVAGLRKETKIALVGVLAAGLLVIAVLLWAAWLKKNPAAVAVAPPPPAAVAPPVVKAPKYKAVVIETTAEADKADPAKKRTFAVDVAKSAWVENTPPAGTKCVDAQSAKGAGFAGSKCVTPEGLSWVLDPADIDWAKGPGEQVITLRLGPKAGS